MHRPENRNRFSESTMRRFKDLERPLCVQSDARRSMHRPENRNRFSESTMRRFKDFRASLVRPIGRTALYASARKSESIFGKHERRFKDFEPPQSMRSLRERASN